MGWVAKAGRNFSACVFLCSVFCGCAASTALIKAPVEQKCAGYGLKGCPDLVDGVLLYVDGDKPGATDKFRRAAAQNAPEEVRKFAEELGSVLPGDTSKEIVALLSLEATATVASPALTAAPARKEPAPGPATDDLAYRGPDVPAAASPSDQADSTERSVAARSEHVQLALAASVDPSRMITESVTPQRVDVRFACDVAGKSGVCVHRQAGPLVVTDARAPAGCSVELFVAAADSNKQLAWLIQANSPGVQGGSFFVRADQSLVIASRGVGMNSEGDARCLVTWAGYRPRIVPANL